MILIWSLFQGSHGVVGRPGFRIGNRTIKRGFQVSFSVSVVESSNLCILAFLQSSLLVLIWLLSWCGLGACRACHDKTKFTENGICCIVYCVLGGEDFADSLVRKGSHLPTHTKISIAYSYVTSIYMWFSSLS